MSELTGLSELIEHPLDDLLVRAAALRDSAHADTVSYSRKVFIPLTHLCRDVCHYCTFAQTPKRIAQAYLDPDQVLEIAERGKALGCKEALFTLGDQPELRYRAAREALDNLGHETTLSYLRAMAEKVLQETGLLPHLNPGVMSARDFEWLRPVAPSMGIMLESSSARLCERGGPHFGSPDKVPAVRLVSIEDAGKARVPLTSGILIGIGETRRERLESLFALRERHARHGHLQEIIIQNFVPKPGTKMHDANEPGFDEVRWTIACARLIFGAQMSIQTPPNLNAGRLGQLIESGINDWGGVSPVTPDYVNPESPWPGLTQLAAQTAAAGKQLVERLTIYPRYIEERQVWLDEGLTKAVLTHADSDGLARTDSWSAGKSTEAAPPPAISNGHAPTDRLGEILRRVDADDPLDRDAIITLLRTRGSQFEELCQAADALRRRVSGDTVRYVVNRNINYTNVCYFKCRFCAFSKGKTSESLRGQPYVVSMEEIARRTEEAWNRGATEVCMQGGIHPAFTGQTYIDICHAAKEGAPDIHLHAFSPLEIAQGAHTLNIPVRDFLQRLKQAGLATLPGTAAEILDDSVRAILCPDKINSGEWLSIIETAHSVGLPTTSTIMFGHMEPLTSWATHLLALRDLQERSGGISEFVPLPFVHMEAPIYLRGQARPGPTFREAVLMHAVARLALHPYIKNIQTSWTKLGAEAAGECLRAGANDLGGTLMNESISRAAGAAHGQELDPQSMDQLIRSLDRVPQQRTTLYQDVAAERRQASYLAAPLAPVAMTHAREYQVARAQ